MDGGQMRSKGHPALPEVCFKWGAMDNFELNRPLPGRPGG